ncbi:hypothetical protein KM043_012625 [Ampulex compressa]|nr:hypothetical protein KM043_012625 [Ampulex compressa]
MKAKMEAPSGFGIAERRTDKLLKLRSMFEFVDCVLLALRFALASLARILRKVLYVPGLWYTSSARVADETAGGKKGLADEAKGRDVANERRKESSGQKDGASRSPNNEIGG